MRKRSGKYSTGSSRKSDNKKLYTAGVQLLAETEGFEPSCPGGQTHFENYRLGFIKINRVSFSIIQNRPGCSKIGRLSRESIVKSDFSQNHKKIPFLNFF